LASKPIDFFLAKKREVTKRQTQFHKGLKVSSKCLKASYDLSLLVAKRKKPHNIAEELIIPCAVEIASIIFDEKTMSLIKAILSSDNTVQRRTQDMASDIVDQVAGKISKFKQFSIQLDESTDTAGEAQFYSFCSGSRFRRHNGAYIVLQQFERKGDRRINF
jgi:hypothetical protein